MIVDEKIKEMIKETSIELGVSEEIVNNTICFVFEKIRYYIDEISNNIKLYKNVQIRIMYFGTFRIKKNKTKNIK